MKYNITVPEHLETIWIQFRILRVVSFTDLMLPVSTATIGETEISPFFKENKKGWPTSSFLINFLSPDQIVSKSTHHTLHYTTQNII